MFVYYLIIRNHIIKCTHSYTYMYKYVYHLDNYVLKALSSVKVTALNAILLYTS